MFFYDWNFSRLDVYTQAFFYGFKYTILLSIALIFFSTLIGSVVGSIIAKNNRAKYFLMPIIDLIKSVPPLVIILFGYFFFSKDIVGISVPAFLTFTISLGVNLSAFIADLTRAAITNVPKDYIELSTAYGLTEKQILKKVIAPIALREILPPLSYLYIEAIKLTSLASIINVKETVYIAQSIIIDTSRSFEVWIIVSIIYILIIFPLTLFARYLESYLKKSSGLF